jgi:hypothetical protein
MITDTAAIAPRPDSPFWILYDILDTGQNYPTGSPNVCCPSCGPYIISSVETFLKYAEAVGYPQNCCACCLNAYAAPEVIAVLEKALSRQPIPKPALAKAAIAEPVPTNEFYLGCTNHFTEEVESLKLLLTPTEQLDFADIGIVEYGSLNADLTSNVSDLKAMLVAFFTAPGNLLTYGAMLENLLSIGFVLWCANGRTYLSSVENYLKWAEAVGVAKGREATYAKEI